MPLAIKLAILPLLTVVSLLAALSDGDTPKTGGFHDFVLKTLEGAEAPLAAYRGKVVLVVNTASRCGFTPQYKDLQTLHAELKDRGLVVIGVPSNDFGGQEPGDATQIREFCTSRFGVDFPLMEKCSVKDGKAQAPLYRWLGRKTGKLPSWNFCKYLVAADGEKVEFFPSSASPTRGKLRQAIERALLPK
jgi:glutathione peroxidase